MNRTPFEDELAERLRSLADHARIEPDRVQSLRPVERSRARRGPLVAAGAAACLVLVVAAVLFIRHDDDPGGRVVTTPSPDVGTIDLGERGWVPVPDPPAGIGQVLPTAVWTGEELIVWGGEDDLSAVAKSDKGAAFNPGTGTWRTLATAPLAARSEHTSVWTGSEMIICCGLAPGGGGQAAAAYDPATDGWRELPDPPFDVQFAASAWTGTEMIVTGGTNSGGTVASNRTAAYDPASDEWETLADPPGNIDRRPDVAWTGDRLIVWPRSVFTDAPGMVYDPGSDTWTTLPTLPEDISIEGASMVWTGKEILVWGPHQAGPTTSMMKGARLPLGASQWAPMAATPLSAFDRFVGTQGSTSAVWTGTEMLAIAGAANITLDPADTPTLAYDPTQDTWRPAVANNPGGGYGTPLIWTGADAFAVNLIIQRLPAAALTDGRTGPSPTEATLTGTTSDGRAISLTANPDGPRCLTIGAVDFGCSDAQGSPVIGPALDIATPRPAVDETGTPAIYGVLPQAAAGAVLVDENNSVVAQAVTVELGARTTWLLVPPTEAAGEPQTADDGSLILNPQSGSAAHRLRLFYQAGDGTLIPPPTLPS